MAPKGDSNKVKDGTVTVNIDDFTRTRDSVLVSLAKLNSAVSDLSRAYINHANTVLGRDPAELDLGIINSGITNSLYEHGLIHRPGSPGAKSEAGGGKRKQRKRHDPNAPKRALTPYFLYMQNNRSQIAEDLGEGARPIDVSAEGTNRWTNMPEAQKAIWKKLYLDNLAKYRQEMSEYKEKKEKGISTKGYDHDNAASNQLQQDVETAEASQAGSDEEESEEEEEEEGESSPSPEPQREPSPPRSGKRRRSDGAKVSTPKAAETAKSPEKKKRGGSKKEKEEEAPPSSARKNATGESKRPKKKRKSEAGGEE